MSNINHSDPFLNTYYGQLKLLNPTPEQICLQDVSTALSRVPRYGGHTREPWTVGQHSLLCADIVEFMLSDSCNVKEPAEILLMALWHDAAEAYVGDVPRPLKRMLGRVYHDIEKPVQRACDLRLVGRERTTFDKILQARYDNIAIAAEISTLNGKVWLERGGWEGLPPLNRPVVEYAHVRVLEYVLMTPDNVRQELENRHRILHQKQEENNRGLK